MENERNYTGNNGINNFGIGLFFGVIAGLLLAPKKGEETRENLKQAFGAVVDKIRTEPAKVRDQIETKAMDLKEKLEENVNNVKDSISGQVEELRSGLENDVEKTKDKLNETKEKIKDEGKK